MSRNSELAKILVKLYDEHSRHEINPPVKILKELEQNVLVIADMEISDEDIPILSKFLQTKKVYNRIERIEVFRSSGGKASRRRSSSALCSNGFRLLKELLRFIEHCPKLMSLSFESVEISVDVLGYLGKALTSSPSAIQWVAFHSCNIGGDEGLLMLTPHLSQMKLQVLAFEYCGLTDASIPYIASILKGQENNLDSLYWNSTLRVDPTDDNGHQLEHETNSVYSCGLVAFSLSGNQLTGKGILHLTRVLRRNYWILGLNFAHNQLDKESLSVLVHALQTNTVIQTVLIKGNPGIDSDVTTELHDVLKRNTSPTSSAAAIAANESPLDPVASCTAAKAIGYNRLQLLSSKVSKLLTAWMKLHIVETTNPAGYSSSPNSPSRQQVRTSQDGKSSQPQQHPDHSFLTQSTVGTHASRYFKTRSTNHPPRETYDAKPLGELVSMRRNEVGMNAGYSVFSFLERMPPPDLEPYRHKSSPLRQLDEWLLEEADDRGEEYLKSPCRRPNSSTADRYSQENAANVGMDDAAAVYHTVTDLEAVTSRRVSSNNITTGTTFEEKMDSVLNLLDPYNPHDDPLENAIATTQSPPRASYRENGASTHLTAATAAMDLDTQIERESWDNLIWNVSKSADVNDRNTIQNAFKSTLTLDAIRPPSRMSIRPLAAHTHGNAERPVSRDNHHRPTNNNRVAEESTVPRYMKSRVGTNGQQQQQQQQQQALNREATLAKLRSMSRAVSSAGRQANVTTARQATTISPPRGRSAVFGKAERDTRIRSRSTDGVRLSSSAVPTVRYYQDHNASNGHMPKHTAVERSTMQRHADNKPKSKKTLSKRSKASKKTSAAAAASTAVTSHVVALERQVQDLTASMAHATRNLEVASLNLQRVSQSFSDSMHMNKSSLETTHIESFRASPSHANHKNGHVLASADLLQHSLSSSAEDMFSPFTGGEVVDADLEQLIRKKLYDKLETMLGGTDLF